MPGGGGFFSFDDTSVKIPITDRVEGCGACGLHKTCNTPKMKYAGRGEKRILLLAEAPGEREDLLGEPLVGKSGAMLKRVLRSLGIDMNRDCWKTNAVVCHPPKNKTPDDRKIAYCRPRLLKEIEELQPEVIICMGGPALKSLIQHRWLGDVSGVGGISRWRGMTIPDRDLNCWVCPVFSPAYVLRSENDPTIDLFFREDIDRAVGLGPIPYYRDEKQDVKIVMDEEAVRDELLRIVSMAPAFIVFDWEATGLRPHMNRLMSCAIATEDCKSVAFPLANVSDATKRILSRVLTHKRLLKGAHHMAFEHFWASQKLGIDAGPWWWDSQLMTHILDNRRKITSLKFQVYVNFGVIDYDSHMKKWLVPAAHKSRKDGANATNQLPELVKQPGGWEQLLTYGGLDAVYEMKLAKLQMAAAGVDLPEEFR